MVRSSRRSVPKRGGLCHIYYMHIIESMSTTILNICSLCQYLFQSIDLFYEEIDHFLPLRCKNIIGGKIKMELLNYITQNALILIPALLIIGQIVKGIEKIPNKYIPLILLPIGIICAMALGGWTADSAIQGVLVTGAAVYGNQIWKQLGKSE